MTLRVLVTGSRDWTDRIAIHSALRKEWWRAGSPPDAVLVHGGAGGADAIAAALWKESGLTVEPAHKPNYDQYGIAAPLFRNQDMVRLGADVLLAFVMPCTKPDHRRWPPHSSHGSTNTIHLAKTAGIRTVIDRRVP